MKCKTCGQELPKMAKTLVVDGIKYETKEHDFNKKLSDIDIPKGWRLWTAEECIKLHNSKYKKKLNLKKCWFFIKQPLKLNKKRGLIARFYADSDWTYLDCYWYPSNHYTSLGVRFCRKVNKK